MMFGVPPRWPLLPLHRHPLLRLPTYHLLRHATTPARNLLTTRSAIGKGSSGGSSRGDSFLVPGATVATLLMLAILHARRMYDDRKIEDFKEKGIELEFSPDFKASFLKLMPLRSISRFWGYMTGMEIPVSLRPVVYKAWARAFHSNLEEVAFPLEKYASLQEFFSHSLKEGSRPIDFDPHCLVSPVDGTVLRIGELKEAGAMIEQVKGLSYSASTLLGSSTFIPEVVREESDGDYVGGNHAVSGSNGTNRKSWWRVSFASPKLRDTVSASQPKGVFYCVIYLWPGDYHRVHSPVDWHVYLRRHFSGHLFPVNERATRTIKNLYTENERVVLEGQWEEGFMAIAAVGATNVGSIKLFIEPELTTNKRKKLVLSEPPDERIYAPEGSGVSLKKGDEIAAFNLGSTVILVFQAPVSTEFGDGSPDFRFCVRAGERVRVGEAIGKWGGYNSTKDASSQFPD